MSHDERKRALALAEANLLPTCELVRAGGDQDAARESRQPARLRGPSGELREAYLGEIRHDAASRPDGQVSGHEHDRGKSAATAFLDDRQVGKHHRCDGRKHHRHHHDRPHDEEQGDAHVALGTRADLTEAHDHSAHGPRVLDRAESG